MNLIVTEQQPVVTDLFTHSINSNNSRSYDILTTNIQQNTTFASAIVENDVDILNGHIYYNETFNHSLFWHNDDFCISYEGNFPYMNVTCDSVIEYSEPLYGYVTPFFMLITLISNSLIVIVLSRKSMVSPTNMILLAMAVCDLLTIVFPAPGLIYMYTLGHHNEPMGPPDFCFLWTMFNETLPAMFHTASIWLTLALAIQRYIYVCLGPVARIWCTEERVRIVIFLICVIAFFHQLPRLLDTTYLPVTIEWENDTYEVCTMETAHWVKRYIGVNLYFSVYFLFRVFFVHLIPCVVLTYLNIFLFRTMTRARKKREKLLNKCTKQSKKLNEKNCTTLMLIVVLSVFLTVEIPLAVITCLHVSSSLYYSFLDYRLANLGVLLTNFFLILSYPINFTIYCGMSRQFRTTFVYLFCKGPSASINELTIIGAGGTGFRNEQSSRSRYSIVNGARTCNTTESIL